MNQRPAGPKALATVCARLRCISPGPNHGLEQAFKGPDAACITIGSHPASDVRLLKKPAEPSCCTLRLLGRTYLVANHSTHLKLHLNGHPVHKLSRVSDGDTLSVDGVSFVFTITPTRDSSAHPRRQQQEKGLAALYETLKRSVRRLGIGR